MKTHSESQRGFALLIVVLLVAFLSVTAATMLDVVSVDQILVGRGASQQRAKALAESGLYEVVSSGNLGTELATLDNNTPTLKLDEPGQPGAILNSSVVDTLGGEYDATITFVRIKAVSDFSQKLFRAAVFDVDVEADAGQGTLSRNRLQIERLIKQPPGGGVTTRQGGSRAR
jgi:Tfp pilus assembly protein PilX